MGSLGGRTLKIWLVFHRLLSGLTMKKPDTTVEQLRNKKQLIKDSGQTPFKTPKPETLIKRIIEISTSQGDLVLDSFLGSGTTAAVAI